MLECGIFLKTPAAMKMALSAGVRFLDLEGEKKGLDSVGLQDYFSSNLPKGRRGMFAIFELEAKTARF